MKTTSKMFSNWSEVTSGERNEIVFERLNKTYGAYEIRTSYDRTLLKAFSATGLFIVFLSATLLIVRPVPVNEIKMPDTETIFKSLNKPDKPLIPKTPEQPKILLSPVTKHTTPVVDDTSEKDPLDIIPKENNNPSSTGNPNDTARGDAPLIPIQGGGGKYIDEDTTTYDGPILQEPPTFPGGDEALFGFLRKNISYPEQVKEIGGKGIVGISFILDKEGNVTDVSVRNATKYFQLDNEALRVVKKLPKWNPGKQQGRPVKVRMILPIRFELKQ